MLETSKGDRAKLSLRPPSRPNARVPEIATLVPQERIPDFINDYQLLLSVAFSYLLPGNAEIGAITRLAVIDLDGIAYQFRDIMLPPQFEPETLVPVQDAVLAGRDKVDGSNCDDHSSGWCGRSGSRADRARTCSTRVPTPTSSTPTN
jgi:hypothetical protein